MIAAAKLDSGGKASEVPAARRACAARRENPFNTANVDWSRCGMKLLCRL